jgi:hypothetical protein
MAEAKEQSKSRFRRWLDKRRESQRRGAEITARSKAMRRQEAQNRRATDHVRGGDGPGPFVGGI